MQRTNTAFHKNIYFTFFLYFIIQAGTAVSQVPSFGWTRTGGDTTYDQGRGVVTDKGRNVIVTGMFEQQHANFSGTILQSAGQHDVLLLKYAPNGSLLWARRAGGTDGDVGHAVAVDTSDNIIVTGEFETVSDFGPYSVSSYGTGDNDAFIAKYDKNGNVAWVRQMGSESDDKGFGVTTDDKGFSYATGFVGGSSNQFSQLSVAGYGGDDIYVAMYDPYGNCGWAKCFGGSGNDRGYSVVYDGGGFIYVTGSFSETASFGSFTLSSNGGTDIFIAKLSIYTGDVVWAKNYGSSSDDNSFKMHRDKYGSLYVAGSFKGSFDFGAETLVPVWNHDIMLLKMDADGNPIWARKAGSGYADYGRGVYGDDFGNVYLCGEFGGYCNFGNGTVLSSKGLNDLFVASYTSDGVLQWALSSGSSTDDVARCMWVNPEGIPYVTGIFRDTVSFSGTQKITYGKEDMFVSQVNLPVATEPNISASNFTATPLNCDGIKLDWTNGNGARRMVIARMEEPVNHLPVDGVTYNASDVWGLGSNLGEKNLVLYSGTGNSLTLTDLLPETEYYFTLVEFNGSGLLTNYSLINLPTAHTMIDGTELYAYSDNDFICGGASTVLHAGGASVLEWTSSSGDHFTGQDISVSPSITTTYKIVGGRGLCADSTEVTVEVSGIAPTLAVNTQDALCNSSCTGSANVTVTGNGPFYYDWTGTGNYTPAITNLCPGDYSVFVYDADGCFNSKTVTINSSALSVVSTKTDASCDERCNGTASTLATGNGTISYLWSNGATTSTINSLCHGIYTVTVSNPTGCQAQDQVTILSATAPEVSLTSTAASCAGICNGSVSTIVSNATAPLTYSWSNGSGQPNLNQLCSGNYALTITDANGCHALNSVSINIAPAPSLTISTTIAASCTGVCNGQANAVIINGTAPFNYLWSNGETTANAAHLCEGSNYLSVHDANGCAVDQYFSAPLADLMQANISVISNAACSGVCNGSVSATVVNGTSPYSYLWNNGQVQATANQLCAGNFSVTITDAAGCSSSAQVTMFTNVPMTATVSNIVPASCSNACNGSANISIANGTGPFNFLWSNGETTANAHALCAGNNSVAITDASGCSINAQVNITTNPMVASIGNIIAASCSAVCNGKATINISSGLAPYNYSWSNGETGATALALCGNSNSVTVTDAAGCTTSQQVNIPVNPAIVLSATNLVSASCANVCNGSATVLVANGTAPFNYDWSNGETSAAAHSLCSGAHNVTVTDASGCAQTFSATIALSPAMVAATTSLLDNSSCNANFCNGSGIVTITNGTAPFAYQWDNGETAATATGLCSGQRQVVVTDVNGCSVTNAVTIQNTGIFISASVSSIMPTGCQAVCNGHAEVTIVNGAQPFSIAWNNGETNPVATQLCNGIGTVEVTDANGCASIAAFTVASAPEVQFSGAVVSTASCTGICNGVATVSAINGLAPYNYLWENGINNATTSGLCAGNYTAVVTDASGCTASTTISITNGPDLAFTISGDAVTCAGSCNGSANITMLNGTAPYSFGWNTGDVNNSISNLCAGNYSVIVSDANGCLTTQNYSVVEDNIQLQLQTQNVNCSGSCNGSAAAMVTGIAPYQYMWSMNAQQTSLVSNLCSGNYSLLVTDAEGCISQQGFIITEPSLLTVQVPHTDATCIGCADGSADAIANGGTQPYSYSWSNGSTAASIQGLTGGNYSVCITDANGCSYCQNFSVLEDPTGIKVEQKDNSISIYPNPAHGEVTLSISGNSSLKKIIIFEADGKLVKEIPVNEYHNMVVVKVDVRDIATGIYILRVESESEMHAIRLSVLN